MRPLTILSGLLFLAILFPACAKKEKNVVVEVVAESGTC